MAITRSKYSQIRRAAGSATSQSNYALTLTKKQKAAEDDYYDNAYSLGSITADQYIQNLNERLTRFYLTPLQKQNIQQKITDVNGDYQNSLIETAYKTGATYNGQVVDSAFMLKRAQDKLATMVPGSEAYNKQQALIQSYTDKVQSEKDTKERTSRKQYRLDKSLEISKMRQDSSVELNAKADMYQTLQAQALADGDTTEAQQYEIQKNNLRQSAERAAVTEKLKDITVTNSTPIAPLDYSGTSGGVPTKTGAASGQTGTKNGVTADDGSQLTDAQKAEQDEILNSKEIQNFMSRAKKIQLQISGNPGKNNGLESSISSAQNTLNEIDKIIKTAPPESQETLLVQRNNVLERLNNLTAQRDELISKLETDYGQDAFDEIVNKKTATIMKKNDSIAVKELQDKIDETEKMFKTGKIDKDAYINTVSALYTAGAQTFADRAAIYESIGESNGMDLAQNRAADFGSKSDYFEKEVKPMRDYVRPVQVQETNDQIINAKGTPGVRKGDIVLFNPLNKMTSDGLTLDEAMRAFDDNYINVGGIYHELNVDTSKSNMQDPTNKKNQAAVQGNYYIKKIDPTSGKETVLPVNKVSYDENRPVLDEQGNSTGETQVVKANRNVLGSDVEKYLKQGYFKKENDGTIVRNYGGTDLKGEGLAPTGFQGIKDELKKTFTQPGQYLSNLKETIKGGAGFLGKAANAMMNNSAPVVFGNMIWPDKNTEAKKQTSINIPKLNLVQPAYAAETQSKAVPVETLRDGTIRYSDGTVRPAGTMTPADTPAVSTPASMRVSTASQQAFIKRFEKEAEKASQLYGVPKEVILAVAGHESGFNPNASTLFGIKGAGQNLKTQEFSNGKFVTINDSFRKYSNTQSAFNDFAKMIATSPRYANAYAVKDNPTAMVKEIKKAGYATDPTWDKKVLSYINTNSTVKPVTQKTIQVAQQQPKQTQVASVPKQTSIGSSIVKPAYAAETTPKVTQPSSGNNQSRISSTPAYSTPTISSPAKVTPTPQQKASVNPAVGYYDQAKQQSVMYKTPAYSTPAKASTPAPKPAPAPAPQTSFVDKAKQAVNNVVNFIGSLFKRK